MSENKFNWGNFAGNLASGFVSGLGDFVSTQTNAYTSNLYNRGLMDYQNRLNKDYSTWNYTNAASLQRAGLVKAGYNPILAVNNGSTFSGGSAGLGSVNVSDSNRASNAYRVNLERKQVDIQGKAQDSQANLNLSAENVNNSQQLLNNAKLNTEYVTQQNIEAQTALTNINTQLGQKDLSWKDRLYLNQVKTNLINAQANRANSIANITNAKSAMINATQGNPWKYGADKVDKYLNNTRSGRFIKGLHKYL